MCGIVGVVSNAPVNQLIYDALLLLQHRGQDAAGIVTQQERKRIADKEREIASLRQAIEDLERQLRAEGGPPGWARP